MEHKHSVYDTDTHFSISPVTRQIKAESTHKTVLIQHDHNSERFSFDLQRYIDGHDMLKCNKVEIHYNNIDSSTKEQKKGVYEVDDLQISPDDENKVVCSWLISNNATQLVGSLNFLLRFCCVEDGVVVYAWNTAINSSISISSGISNGDAAVEEYPDILAQWKNELFGVGDTEEQRLLNVSAEQQGAITAHGAAVLASIPEEYGELSAKVDTTERIKAPAIILNAEGKSIAVNDSADAFLQGLKVFGKSTQDGEPTPDNPQEIHSVENAVVTVHGKNLIPPRVKTAESAGLTFTANVDGTVAVVGTANADEDSTFHVVLKNSPLTLPKGDYLLSGVQGGSEKTFRILLYKTDWTFLTECTDGSKLFSLDQTTDVFVYVWVCRGTTVNKTFYPMIRHASIEDEAFDTYKKQAFPVPWTLPGIPVETGGNYTDENGQQWICDEIDLARGVHVQRINRLVFDGAETWGVGSEPYPLAHIVGLPPSINDLVGLFSHGVYQSFSSALDGFYAVVFANGILRIRLGHETSVDEFKAYLNKQYANGTPVTVYYPIATPIETPLSDAEIAAFKALRSNKPTTTILNDSGAFMGLEYVADTKTYIDNLLKG